MEHSKVTKLETFHWPLNKDVSPLTTKHHIHSKGHQAWNLPLAFNFPSFLSFFFCLKTQIQNFWLSLFTHDF
jgi:hypothetical protein